MAGARSEPGPYEGRCAAASARHLACLLGRYGTPRTEENSGDLFTLLFKPVQLFGSLKADGEWFS